MWLSKFRDVVSGSLLSYLNDCFGYLENDIVIDCSFVMISIALIDLGRLISTLLYCVDIIRLLKKKTRVLAYIYIYINI